MPALASAYAKESKRQRYEILRTQLDSERSDFVPDWMEINDNILPGRGRFNSSEVNRRRSRKKIIDSTGSIAARHLASGFMAYMTSPAREWKELTIPDDPDLMKWGPVKEWLEKFSKGMSDVHRQCGLYRNLPVIYKDLGGFGTASMLVDEDLTGRVIRTHPFAIGSYYLANGENGRASVFMRVFQMTVRQVVEKFGRLDRNNQPDWSNMSSYVRSEYELGHYESYVEVVHVIHPNPEFNPRLLFSKYKKFASCYYETGAVKGSSQGNYMEDSGNRDLFLSEMGYDYFPVLGIRWAVTDGDSYGTECPGMEAIGDVKSLQVRERMIARGEEKGINPAMVGSPQLKTTKASTLPGDITYDPSPADKSFRKAHDIQFNLEFSEQKQESVRRRIKEAFYENLFLSVSSDTRKERGTAYEWSLKKQEDFAALGPVVENISDEGLDPLVDITAHIMFKQGRVPEPPRELQGRKLGVRYVSAMAQAQKATGLGGVERFLSIAGAIATQVGDPKVITRKLDVNKTLETVGEMTGIPAAMLRDEEEVAAIEQQEAQAQAEAQRIEQINAGAQAAQRLAAAKTDQPNALTDLASAAAAGQDGQ